MQDQPLFDRLGGTPGIHSLVDDIVARHMENPVIATRFRPYLETPDKLEATKQHLCDFLEAGSGGSAEYTGRSMEDAHKGMNINEAEYMAAMDDILAAMQTHAIDDETQKDVLSIAYSLKDQIMHV